jgi:hydrogenase maturation protein HypF
VSVTGRAGPGDLLVRRALRIAGTVQGVGFRPFVYRLAQRYALTGEVHNDSRGVLIDAEGTAGNLDGFTASLCQELPHLARIESMEVSELEPRGGTGFVIAASIAEAGHAPMVPADVSICPDCLRELADPRDRRFGYPFLNCTNCGPRYSIVRETPYDRALTTMARFRMCPACQAEYRNPLDRRFHAEANACPVCGPTLTLVETPSCSGVGPIAEGAAGHASDVIGSVRALLASGLIVAIKGLGGFHLACDATNDEAVRTLRERKRRSGKAFALMLRDTAEIEKLCIVAAADRAALESPRRPILLLRRQPDAGALSSPIAPGNARLGVMLPYTPLHYLLFGANLTQPPWFRALVMTSGNLSEEPILSDNGAAMATLRGIADAFLLHDRDIQTPVDDSVVFTFRRAEVPVRRSRGYAPQPVNLGRPLHELLAVGGQMKNTFCLTKGHHAILSQHIGDLENSESMNLFEAALSHMRRFFRVQPVAVAHDLHPGYTSTRFAERLGIRPVAVQHHHAHIASCMAEHRLEGEVIGLAMDGTGYGADGQIWGGEVLLTSRTTFRRRFHLRYFHLAGGDAAVREVWRSGLSCLLDTFGATDGLCDLPLLNAVPPQRLSLVRTMLERGLNTVQTSSCGRLFDAVASILNIRQQTTYEGQAAVELESVADPSEQGRYGFEIAADEIDMRTAIMEIVDQQRRAVATPVIAARFHNTMVAALAAAAMQLHRETGLRRVCLSGGSFQNLWLLEGVTRELELRGLEVFSHRLVPSNDGGLCLGQAAVADALLRGLAK